MHNGLRARRPNLGLGVSGQYQVVIFGSVGRAYSQIKEEQPDVVILHVDFNDTQAFQVLSMLALDHETCGIPVIARADRRISRDFICTTSSHDLGIRGVRAREGESADFRFVALWVTCVGPDRR